MELLTVLAGISSCVTGIGAAYYKNREHSAIRQYEYENFLLEYRAYKALRGNSFIDRIYQEVKTWDIVS